jgi:hypothetical protein
MNQRRGLVVVATAGRPLPFVIDQAHLLWPTGDAVLCGGTTLPDLIQSIVT